MSGIIKKSLLAALTVTAVASCSSSNTSGVSTEVTLSVTSESISRSEVTREALITTIEIPRHHHIYGPFDATFGKPTRLVASIESGSIPLESIGWPQTKRYHSEVLSRSYDGYEGEISFPIVLTEIPLEAKQLTLTLSYILCNVQCTPGETSFSVPIVN